MAGEPDFGDGLEPVEDAADNGLGKEDLPAIVGGHAMVPAFFAAGGERAGYAFIDFFTAQIRNRNTRAAYAVAVRTFFSWAEARELTIETLRTHHVAAYVELLGKRYQRAHREAAPGRHPHAVRLAGRPPGHRDEPGRGGARPQARRQARQDPGARGRRGAPADRQHRLRHARSACATGRSSP